LSLKPFPIRFNLICLFSFSILLVSCAGSGVDPKVGGLCTYENFPGTAKFTELKVVPNGVEAHFDFTPTDPNAPTRYRIHNDDKNITLFLDGSGLPSADWLSSKGITVGSEFSSICMEERTGTCTPLMYTLTAIPGVHGQ